MQMSDLLREIVGNRGTLTRYGGEEFIIILQIFRTRKPTPLGVG
ncbi:hypothetical protein [Caldibacillus thermoamylovorans]